MFQFRKDMTHDIIEYMLLSLIKNFPEPVSCYIPDKSAVEWEVDDRDELIHGITQRREKDVSR